MARDATCPRYICFFWLSPFFFSPVETLPRPLLRHPKPEPSQLHSALWRHVRNVFSRLFSVWFHLLALFGVNFKTGCHKKNIKNKNLRSYAPESVCDDTV